MTAFMSLEYVPLLNTSQIQEALNATNGTNNTISYVQYAMGTFFPKVDVYTVLKLNGTDGKDECCFVLLKPPTFLILVWSK